MHYNVMDLSLFNDYMVTVNVLPVCTWIYTAIIVLHKTENQEITLKNNNNRRKRGLDNYCYCLIVAAASFPWRMMLIYLNNTFVVFKQVAVLRH